MTIIPRCPRCGEPARVAVLNRARVRCQLEADGTIGRVLSMSKETDPPIAEFECSGGHSWKANAS
jgi:hypothetical protein